MTEVKKLNIPDLGKSGCNKCEFRVVKTDDGYNAYFVNDDKSIRIELSDEEFATMSDISQAAITAAFANFGVEFPADLTEIEIATKFICNTMFLYTKMVDVKEQIIKMLTASENED